MKRRKRLKVLERARGFEPLTTCLGSKDSTTELRPLTLCFQTVIFYPQRPERQVLLPC